MVISIAFAMALPTLSFHPQYAQTAHRGDVTHRAAEVQDEEKPIGVGVEIGIVAPPGLGLAFGAGVRGSYRIPVKNWHIRAGADIAFFSGAKKGSGSDSRVGGSYSYTTDVFALPLLLDAALEIPAGPTVTPFVGLGFGSTWVRSVETALDSTNTESQFVGTFRVYAGADIPLGSGFLGPEVRYTFSNASFLSTGNANIGGFGLYVGYRFAL